MVWDLMPLDQGSRFKSSQGEPGSSHTAVTNVARRGSGSGPVHSSLEEAMTEESVNHAGLLQFGIEQQYQD